MSDFTNNQDIDNISFDSIESSEHEITQPNIILIDIYDDEEKDEEEKEEEKEEEDIQDLSYLNINENNNIFTIPVEFSNEIEITISNKINEIIEEAYQKLTEPNNDILNFLNLSYLENLQYDDNDANTLKYTIRSILNNSIYQFSDIYANVLYISITGINQLFEKNYDLVVELLTTELKTILRRGYMFGIFTNIINQVHNMEDIKMVLNENEISKLLVKTYKDIDIDIKNKNIKCSICQEEHNELDKIRLLPCEHIFHKDCIDEWLTNHSYKCPCCRNSCGCQNIKK